MSVREQRALVFLVVGLICTPGAFADVSFSWNTQDYGGTGSWRDPNHWSPKGTVPGTVDSANTFVNIGAPLSGLEASQVTLSNGSTIGINSLTIGPRLSPLPPEVVGENTLTIDDYTELDFRRSEANPHPTINNSGIIKLYGWLWTGNTDLDRVEITGPGKVRLIGTGQHFTGQFKNAQLIEGEGVIAGTMSNQGTIRATNGKTLKIYIATKNEGGVLTTDGYADSLATSTLLIGAGIEGGTIDAHGGLVRFVTSEIQKNVTLTGGQMAVEWPGLRMSGAGTTVNPDTILSSTAAGAQPGTGPTELRLLENSTLQNNGVIRIESSYYTAKFYVPDKSYTEGITATLTGNGRLVLKGTSSAVNWLEVGSLSSLVHEAGHTIEGAGNIGGGTITNKGRIIAKNGTLTVTSTIWNSGTLGADPGGILELTTNAKIIKTEDSAGVIATGGGTTRFTGATVTNCEWGTGTTEFYYSTSSTPAVYLAGINHFQLGSVVDFVANSSGTYYGIAVIPGPHTVVNDGTLRMNGRAELWSGVKNGTTASTAILTGTGKLVLAPIGYAVPNLSGYAGSGFINDVLHTIQGAGNLNAPIENRGTIIAENGYLRAYQPITGAGCLRVKDSGVLMPLADLRMMDFQMDTGAVLIAATDKTIELSGNFSFSQTSESKWTRSPILKMNGGVPGQRLEVGGTNMGLSWSGFNDPNFRLPKLTVENDGTWVSLVDFIDNGNRTSPEALYVATLIVNPGATLNLNGLSLYTVYNGNPHLVLAGEGGLFGGGEIVDVPEVKKRYIGDFNDDERVNLADVLLFAQCFSGPAIPYATGCGPMNLDNDSDVDQSDFGLMQRCFAGSRNPPPECEIP